MKRPGMAIVLCGLFLSAALSGETLAASDDGTTYPAIPESVSPVTELNISEHAYAAVRKPPGPGPFPAIVFLHGGLGHSQMSVLRRGSLGMPTQARFLAWGYVTVNATRRSITHDPSDRGVVEDTVGMVDAVKALPYVDAGSVGLYGGSGGGSLALEVAGATDLAGIVAGEPATIIYTGMFNKEHVLIEKGKVTGDRRWDVMNANASVLYTPTRRAHTRAKIRTIRCPVLILHGDQHVIKNVNFDVFVPELKDLGVDVTVKHYPGENHGFYWGEGKDMSKPLKANRDADAFFRKHIRVAPNPVDTRHLKATKIEPRRARR